MTSEYDIESSIGLFDVAISHSSDTLNLAQSLANYATAYGLRCYSYTGMQVDQLGFDIRGVMKFVYTRTPRFIVINSPLYRTTDATKLEFQLISNNDSDASVVVFEMGRDTLSFPAGHSRKFIENVADTEVINVMRDWKKSLNRDVYKDFRPF